MLACLTSSLAFDLLGCLAYLDCRCFAWLSLFAAVVDYIMIWLLECMSSGSLVLWCLVALLRFVLHMVVV